MVERCDEEFIKVLKGCDAHSHEYVDRLKDEPKVTELLEMAQILVDKLGSPSEMCRIYLKRIEHVYFKFDTRVIQQKNVSSAAEILLFYIVVHPNATREVSCSHAEVSLMDQRNCCRNEQLTATHEAI